MSMRHSVVPELKRCRGCTICIKCYPIEAIWVRGCKATILPGWCIDCGSCIRICPHKATKPVGDSLDILKQYQYCVALPESALYGQFWHLDSVDTVLNGPLKIGFHKVYEVAKAAEMIPDPERQSISGGLSKVAPQISSSYPTVLRLIRMHFPKSMGHMVYIILPMELVAILARWEAAEETGLPSEAISILVIVPYSSKVTAAWVSEGLGRPVLDGALAIRDIYLRLLNPMRELEEVTPVASAGILGLDQAPCGGESVACLGERCVAADGIQDVIRMLEEIEDGRLPEADSLELPVCTQGCVGGCFNAENPYAAKLHIKGLFKGLPVFYNRFPFHEEARDIVRRDKELQYLPALVLDQDREMAISKQLRIQKLKSHLPGLYRGSCGAPSCRVFAEDAVLGRASEDDCIFKVRECMRSMAGSKEEVDDYLSPSFRRRQEPPEQTLPPP